jgi:cysteine desulfurase/selenocysteine lyase
MPPYQGGGDMVKTVSFDKTVYADLPYKFEAGTANYIGAIGLAVAIDFVNSIGLQNIGDAEKRLLHYATERLQHIGGVRIFGNAADKAPLISLIINDLHHLDVGQILDRQGIAVRTGTLCAEPLMRHYGLTGMLRASLAFCNTSDDVDALATGIELAVKMLK